MSPLSAQIRYIVLALLPFAVLAGCASAEKERAAQAQLEKARMAYQQAQADPNVQKYAASRLAEAQKAVQGAEHAKNLDDMQQLSYVAEQKPRSRRSPAPPARRSRTRSCSARKPRPS